MKRAFAAIVSGFALLIFVFFAFFWNGVATNTANQKLENTGMHIERSFQGAFPFHFSVPKMTIIPGEVTLRDAHLKYDGTYNPFKMMSQNGRIMHARGILDIDMFDRHTEIYLDEFYLDRNHNHWFLETKINAQGIIVDLNTDISLDNIDESILTLRTMNVTIECTPTSLMAMYKDHQLLDLKLFENNHFSVLLGSILQLTGQHLLSEHSLELNDVLHAFFEHSLQPTFHSLLMKWSSGDFEVNLDGYLDVKISDGNVIVGSYHSARNIHLFKSTTRSLQKQVMLKFTPPLHTPLGMLRDIAMQNRQKLIINVGRTPLVLSTKSISYGPISLIFTDKKVALEINGGKFQSFLCTYIHAFIDYNNPDVLVLQNATAHQWGEEVSGQGHYNMATRRADVSVKLTR